MMLTTINPINPINPLNLINLFNPFNLINPINPFNPVTTTTTIRWSQIKMNHMFPKNIKLHLMETRKPEKFTVQHSNTERLKRSPIIFMQNLLNEYENNVKE